MSILSSVLKKSISLDIDDFINVCEETGQKLLVAKHPGYDHGYYFINSFIEDHINYHVSILKNLG